MQKPKIPTNEKQRQAALDSYEIIDSLPEQSFDDLTLIASQICDTPIALVSLIDNDRQWFKSKFGIEANETHRNFSFCGHAINEPKETFEVKNAKTDARFSDNPLVTGDLDIGFYAGVPLTDSNELALGTLCVIDQKPRELTDHQKSALEALAREVMNLIRSRKNELRLESEAKINLDELETLRSDSFRYQSLIEFAPHGIAITDLKGNMLQTNGVFEAMMGYSKEELDVISVADLTHPDDIEETKINIGKLVRNEVRSFTMEKRYFPKSKQIIWARVSSAFVTNEQGKPEYLMATIEDITDKRRKEEEFKLNTERLNLAMKGARDGILDWININADEHWWSPAFYEMLGYQHGEMEASMSNFMSQLLHSNDFSNTQNEIQKCLKGGKPFDVEFRLKTKENQYIWCRGRGNVINEEDGTPLRMTGIVSNINEQKKLEIELKETRGFLKKITDIAPSVIYVFNQETMSNEYANKELGSVLGYSIKEIQQMGADFMPTLCHPDDLPRVFDHFQTVANLKDKEVVSIEYRMKHKNGEYRWLLSEDTTFERNKEGKLIKQLGVATDITKLKIAQEKLAKSERFQKKINDIVPSIIYIFNQETMSNEYANKELGTVLGYSVEEVQQMGAGFMPTLCHPDDLPRVFGHFQTVANLKDKEAASIEYRIKHKDGNYRWLLSEDTTFERNEEGKLVKQIGVATDITTIKETQEKLSKQTHALQSQNEDLKQFAYIATHDLKNPILTVEGHFNYIKENLNQPSEEITDSFEFIDEELENFNTTLKGLNEAIKIREAVTTQFSIDFNNTVQSILPPYQKQVEELGGELVLDLVEDTHVKGTEVFVKSILQNLISNAIKYRSLDKPPVISIKTKVENQKLIITIQDNGLGIDLEKQKDKVFKMFSRFHRHQEGDGMGLHMVKNMVEKIGGSIAIESKVNLGTTFTVTLNKSV